MGTARTTASHCATSASGKNFLPSGSKRDEDIFMRTSGKKRRANTSTKAPKLPYPTIPTERGIYFFFWRRSQATSKGDARKIDEYVPIIIPTASVSAKVCVVAGPRK